MMLLNYWKTALRNIRNNKLFALLNIFGLAIGLSSAILIFLWVRDERSYDRFNSDAARIFRLTADVKGTPSAATPPAFGRIGAGKRFSPIGGPGHDHRIPIGLVFHARMAPGLCLSCEDWPRYIPDSRHTCTDYCRLDSELYDDPRIPGQSG